MPDLIHVILEFLSNRERFDRFFAACLIQTQKNNHDLSKVSQKDQNRVNLDLPKVSKINIKFELLKNSKMTSLKIFISPVMEKLKTLNLDT